jgi:hypothetical protein
VKNTKTHTKAKHAQMKNWTQWQMKRLKKYCTVAGSNGQNMQEVYKKKITAK